MDSRRAKSKQLSVNKHASLKADMYVPINLEGTMVSVAPPGGYLQSQRASHPDKEYPMYANAFGKKVTTNEESLLPSRLVSLRPSDMGGRSSPSEIQQQYYINEFDRDLYMPIAT